MNETEYESSRQRVCYFDHNATTPVAPEVVEAMLPYLRTCWGNPSSAYGFGSHLVQALDEARIKTAELIGAEPREILFTSCGTESNNTALHSALRTQSGKRHVLMTAVEHSANLNYARSLQQYGYEVAFLPVSPEGLLDLRLVEKSIRPDTAIVSVMLANNETGILFPIAEIAEICRQKAVLFHSDAVQAPGKIRLDVKELGVDFLSLSAHKLRAPKGIGVLFVKSKTKFQPYVVGGHQERHRRGGTENVAGIVALGKAAELAMANLAEENTRIKSLRDHLEEILLRLPQSHRNGAREPRLPNTSNLSFDGVEAEAMLMLLDQAGICASSGSACTTGSLEPSHVLTAMGIKPERARASLRLSLGIENTAEDVDYLLRHLPVIIAKLRSLAPTAIWA
jgi:cysteine desulfurase